MFEVSLILQIDYQMKATYFANKQSNWAASIFYSRFPSNWRGNTSNVIRKDGHGVGKPPLDNKLAASVSTGSEIHNGSLTGFNFTISQQGAQGFLQKTQTDYEVCHNDIGYDSGTLRFNVTKSTLSSS